MSLSLSLDLWLTFVVASFVLCFSPGPTVFLVISQSLTHGKASVFSLLMGVVLAGVITITLSFLGMGVLLSGSVVLFNTLKWIGALYLVYLGIKTLLSKVEKTATEALQAKQINREEIFLNCFIITVLNPKGMIFFTAFFPLFINPKEEILSQMIILGATFLVISALCVSFYGLFSGIVRSKVKSVKFQKRFNIVSGYLLIGTGAITALLQR